jgi:hypothetical protein
MKLITRGIITLTDKGLTTDLESERSAPYIVIVTTTYEIDSDKQLLSYVVTVNGTEVKRVDNIEYSYETLHNAALQAFYRNMYKGLPELTININRGAYGSSD